MNNIQKQYVLMLADNALVLGQRMGEWLSHAPEMELDMAAGNFALDMIGQAKLFYELLANEDGEARTADEIAMTRREHEYVNVQLTEQPNLDWGHSSLRHYFFSVFLRLQYQGLENFPDENVRAIAAKAIKEVDYHIRFAQGWVIRLGDGTAESRNYMNAALERLWRFTGAMFTPSSAEQNLIEAGSIRPLSEIKFAWETQIFPVLSEATLELPEDTRMLLGGKQGKHTEHLGHILAELQYMQRSYPGLNW